jgi:hypothetical protein
MERIRDSIEGTFELPYQPLGRFFSGMPSNPHFREALVVHMNGLNPTPAAGVIRHDDVLRITIHGRPSTRFMLES